MSKTEVVSLESSRNHAQLHLEMDLLLKVSLCKRANDDRSMKVDVGKGTNFINTFAISLNR